MRILFLAPHPFYQERGTPIAVDLLLSSLSKQGHIVDVVVFPEGEDREHPNVTFHRVKPWISVEGVRPGFSLKKLYLDIFVFFTFVRLFFSRSYDAVHAVEESAYMAMLCCPLKRVPFVYDMDSSMVTQLLDKMRFLRFVERPLRWLESLPARFAKVVVPCCEALADDVRQVRKSLLPTITLKDVSLLDKSSSTSSTGFSVSKYLFEHARAYQDNAVVSMYIGNLEAYQGIDLMLEGFQKASAKKDNLYLIVVGGEDEHIQHYQKVAEDLGISDCCFFVGKQPVQDLYALMLQADIMLSPRTQGVNTPMKVYSYLDSGRPVLATRLPTHTQVMTDAISFLVEPDPVDFGKGLLLCSEDQEQVRSKIRNAEEFIRLEHSLEAFEQRVAQIYEALAR